MNQNDRDLGTLRVNTSQSMPPSPDARYWRKTANAG